MNYKQTLLCLSIVVSTTFAQTTKIFSGAFNAGFSIQHTYRIGEATYEYHETPDLVRVWNGPFKWSNGTMSVQGNFKNDYRVGLWTFNHINVQGGNDRTLTGTYNANGQRIGKWTYTKGKETKWVTYFKDGHFIGNFDYEEGEDTRVKGQFDNNGNLDSV